VAEAAAHAGADGSKIAQAIDYSLNAWSALTLHLDDGAVPIDNNLIERQIKPWKLGARTGCSWAASSLTMSYFHTGIRTIIGAEAFHCPVRDGKEWDHLAMVIRLDGLPSVRQASEFIESNQFDCVKLWHNTSIIVKVIGSSLTSN
jgi:hypothetical protein